MGRTELIAYNNYLSIYTAAFAAFHVVLRELSYPIALFWLSEYTIEVDLIFSRKDPEMVSKKHFHKPQAIVCKAAVANLRFVQENISKYLENVHCLPSTLLNIEMILEELFVNIASYAYPDSEGSVSVEVSLDESPLAVRITLRDHGIPYNPLETSPPDLALSAKDRKIGGLGIFLSRKFADSLEYKHVNNENVTTFTKNLP